ncbi:hypothetical protein REC12_20515 [Desulfosporosinus sp. PR]|uniref:hypothetical protein n=1 Tax=Candidatus Desulfosporosinus nitrosoreducens TaxID=3401928 RepID=UPI0027F2F6E6|nr:hypothetical protein [Desulfosporosinus sp. PR]MDQ7095982.1 hypothetical protein [Desulfosporosinus sp. PR]
MNDNNPDSINCQFTVKELLSITDALVTAAADARESAKIFLAFDVRSESAKILTEKGEQYKALWEKINSILKAR